MASRWRERKGTFVSSAELQARRSALLAPVQKYRRAWVQVSPESSYKVLKWVPRHSLVGAPPGLASGPSQVHSFLQDTDPIDPSTDEDDDEGPDRDGSIEVLPAPHAVSAELGSSDDPKRARELKMTRKTSKAVEDAARVGGQLAGLETGEIVEQIALDEDDDEPGQDRPPASGELPPFALRPAPAPSTATSSAFAVQQHAPARLPANEIADVTMDDPTGEDESGGFGPFGPFDQQPQDVEMSVPEPDEPVSHDILPDGPEDPPLSAARSPAGPNLLTAAETILAAPPSGALEADRFATPIAEPEAQASGASGEPTADAPAAQPIFATRDPTPQPPASQLPQPDPRSGAPVAAEPNLTCHQSPPFEQTAATPADGPSVRHLSLPASSAHLDQPGSAQLEHPSTQLRPNPDLSTSLDVPGPFEAAGRSQSSPAPGHSQPPSFEPQPDAALERETINGAGRRDGQLEYQAEASAALETTTALGQGEPDDQRASRMEVSGSLEAMSAARSGGSQLVLGDQISPSVALEPAEVAEGSGPDDLRATRMEASESLEVMAAAHKGGAQFQLGHSAALEPAMAAGGGAPNDPRASRFEVSNEALEMMKPGGSGSSHPGDQISALGSLHPPTAAGIDSSPNAPLAPHPSLSLVVPPDAGRTTCLDAQPSFQPDGMCAIPTAAALESLAAQLSRQAAGPVLGLGGEREMEGLQGPVADQAGRLVREEKRGAGQVDGSAVQLGSQVGPATFECLPDAGSEGAHAGAGIPVEEPVGGQLEDVGTRAGRSVEEPVANGHAEHSNGERLSDELRREADTLQRGGGAESKGIEVGGQDGSVEEPPSGDMDSSKHQLAAQRVQADWQAKAVLPSGAGMETTNVPLGALPSGGVPAGPAAGESGAVLGQIAGHGQVEEPAGEEGAGLVAEPAGAEDQVAGLADKMDGQVAEQTDAMDYQVAEVTEARDNQEVERADAMEHQVTVATDTMEDQVAESAGIMDYQVSEPTHAMEGHEEPTEREASGIKPGLAQPSVAQGGMAMEESCMKDSAGVVSQTPSTMNGLESQTGV